MNYAPIITGLGLVTPLGMSARQTWDALLAGRYLSNHSRVGGIDAPDRVVALAQSAAMEAIEHARWPRKLICEDETALIVATSKGPIESWIGPNATVGGLNGFGLSEIAGELSSSLGFGQGPRLTISAACASGLHGLIVAAMKIRCGEIRRALVVAAESSLHPLFVSSFNRLGVLAPEGHGCRPFDQNRKGFILSEAAGAVCVEAAEQTAGPALARIERFALAGDAAHLTANDPTGRTSRRMLRQVIQGRDIDLIHAHGTGTVLNDPAELEALEAEISPSQSAAIIYSHKGALGHSLGASGMISIVLNCMAHQYGVIPGNVRTAEPLDCKSLLIDREPRHGAVGRSLAMASGFGGAMGVVSLASA